MAHPRPPTGTNQYIGLSQPGPSGSSVRTRAGFSLHCGTSRLVLRIVDVDQRRHVDVHPGPVVRRPEVGYSELHYAHPGASRRRSPERLPRRGNNRHDLCAPGSFLSSGGGATLSGRTVATAYRASALAGFHPFAVVRTLHLAANRGGVPTACREPTASHENCLSLLALSLIASHLGHATPVGKASNPPACARFRQDPPIACHTTRPRPFKRQATRHLLC